MIIAAGMHLAAGRQESGQSPLPGSFGILRACALTVGAGNFRTISDKPISVAFHNRREFIAHIVSLTLLLGRHVSRRQRRTFSKEELLQMLHDHFLILRIGRIQAVLVQHHLAVLAPHPPRFFRYLVVNTLPQFGIKRRLIQARHLTLKLYAVHHPLSRTRRHCRHGFVIATHEPLLTAKFFVRSFKTSAWGFIWISIRKSVNSSIRKSSRTDAARKSQRDQRLLFHFVRLG